MDQEASAASESAKSPDAIRVRSPGVEMTSPGGKKEVLDMSAAVSLETNKAKACSTYLEYVKDGSVDFRDNPAIISNVGGHKSLLFSLGCQVVDRIGYYGITTNLVLYLTTKLHMSNSKAATDVNNWLAYVFSLLAAVVADTYTGRYWASLGSLMIQMIGFALVLLTTCLPSLEPLKCQGNAVTCPETSGLRKTVFYVALYILAVGIGGFIPCIYSFGADQYDENHPVEVNQRSLYFNLLYAFNSSAGLFGNTVVVYIEQSVSYKLGYAISAGSIAIAFMLCVAGTSVYRYQKPQGNPLLRILQVWVAAARNWNRLPVPEQLYEEPSIANSKNEAPRSLPHTNHFRFLDKAAVASVDPSSTIPLEENKRNPWKLCTITQVEEAKFLLRVAPLWISAVFYSTLYGQTLSTFVEQAAAMDNRVGHFQIPPASLSTIQIVSVCILTVAYEKCVVPVARRFTGHPRGLTMLQRISVGLVLIVIAMTSAAVVEIIRLNVAKHHGLRHSSSTALVPMSIFWLVPQYFLVGASEFFTYVGQFEFFYDQAPEKIRGISFSLELAGFTVGNYVGSAIISVITAVTSRHGSNSGWISDNLNNGHLDYFYWTLVLLGTLNFFGYLAFAHTYKYKNVAPIEEKGSP